MYFWVVKAEKLIRSTQNPWVKKLRLLQEKSRERKKAGCFVIEGQREVSIALRAGYRIERLFFCPDILPHPTAVLQMAGSDVETIALARQVYQKVAYRDTTEGILAVVKCKLHTLETIRLQTKRPLVLVAEAPEKPGNVGALLRTADAAALDAVLIANPRSDLYHPNLIRASVGAVFTLPIAMGTSAEIAQWLRGHCITIYGAALGASELYADCDFTGATALVVGTEATGLSGEWLSYTDRNVIIPMQGAIDSMNVSVAAGILIFEAKRQRGFL